MRWYKRHKALLSLILYLIPVTLAGVWFWLLVFEHAVCRCP